MKRPIVNRKRPILIFIVMFLGCGIVGFGYAHFDNEPHFHHESMEIGVLENAEGGTIVGPVSADNFDDTQHTTGDPKQRYVLRGTDALSFQIDSQTGLLRVSANVTTVGSAGTSYSVKVVVQTSQLVDKDVVYADADSIDVTIEVISLSSVAVPDPGEDNNDDTNDPPPDTIQSTADAIPGVSSEERARIAAALAMDRVIFNELRNATTDAHDWVELRNVSDTNVPLDGWEVRIVTGETIATVAFPSGTVLPARGLLLLVNTDPDAPEMPLSIPEGNVVSVVDAGLILPASNFTLLLRSDAAWEDSVGNFFFGHEIPPTAPPLTTDAAWYRARPDVLGYQSEAWVMSGYQEGIGYDVGVPATIALGTPGYSHTSLTADVNGDGIVNILDLVWVASYFDEAGATDADLNGDGEVNIQDLVLVSDAFGQVVDTQ